MPELVVEYIYEDGDVAVWSYDKSENLTEAFAPILIEGHESSPTGLLSITIRPRREGEEVMV